MHIHKFADIASFAEIGVGGNLPATEEYREFIKKLQTQQDIFISLSVISPHSYIGILYFI